MLKGKVLVVYCIRKIKFDIYLFWTCLTLIIVLLLQMMRTVTTRTQQSATRNGDVRLTRRLSRSVGMP